MNKKAKVEHSRNNYIVLLQKTLIKATQRDGVVLRLQILDKEIYELLLHTYNANCDVWVGMIKDFYDSKNLNLREKELILKQNKLADKNLEIHKKQYESLKIERELVMIDLLRVNEELQTLIESLGFSIEFYSGDLNDFELMGEKKKKYRSERLLGIFLGMILGD